MTNINIKTLILIITTMLLMVSCGGGDKKKDKSSDSQADGSTTGGTTTTGGSTGGSTTGGTTTGGSTTGGSTTGGSTTGGSTTGGTTTGGTTGGSTSDIEITTSSQSISESIGQVDIQISITPSVANSIDLSLAVSGTSGVSDHDLANTTITIPANSTSYTHSFNVTNDVLVERNETIIATISNPQSTSSVQLGTTTQVTFTVTDNESVSISPVYSSYSNWNDYVKISNFSLKKYNQTETVCAGTEFKYNSCAHGGELKKLNLPEISSCTNITATDDLGVFDWVCDNSSGNAVIYSTGLKNTKSLRDLIDFSGVGWKNNHIVVKESSTTIATSNSTAWWSNVVKSLPTNTGAGALNLPDGSDNANTVYIQPTSANTSGYNLNADKLSIVTAQNALLTYSGNSTNNCNVSNGENDGSNARICVFATGTHKFLWFEANVDCKPSSGTQANHGFITLQLTHSMIRSSQFYNCGAWPGRALTLSGAFSNMVYGIKGSGGIALINIFGNVTRKASFNHIENVVGANYDEASSGNGVVALEYSSGYRVEYNVLHNISVSNHRTHSGIYLFGDSADNNIFSKITTASNYLHGFILNDGEYNIATHITSVNNRQNGIKHTDRNIVAQVLTSNNAQAGYDLSFSNASGSMLSSIASVDNAGVGINSTDQNMLGFKDYIIVGNNNSSGAQCSSSGTNPGLENSTCTISGTEDSNDYNNANSNALLKLARSTASSFVGKASSDSLNTTSGASGSGSFLYSAITDWVNFSNMFRLFGLDGGTYPISTNRSACASGNTCRIWDYSLASSDTQFRNKSGDATNSNETFTAGATCPSAVHGNKVIDGYDFEAMNDANGDEDGICEVSENCDTNIFLVNALEITLDGIGDDDTLCESNEACVYSPNIGSYQGHGDYTTNGTCNFTNGSVTGVSMYAYPSNGR